MNKRQWRRIKRNVVNNWRELLGCGYVLGRRFMGDPPVGDCRGLYDFGWEMAGALAAIGGKRHLNVRHLHRQGEQLGLLLPPDAPTQKGDAIIYYEPKGQPTPSNPKCIRHVAGVEFPDSPAHPGGVAIGATNPQLGVIRHNHALTEWWLWPDDEHKKLKFGLAILNIFRPSFALLDASDEPSGDSEPPPEPEQ